MIYCARTNTSRLPCAWDRISRVAFRKAIGGLHIVTVVEVEVELWSIHYAKVDQFRASHVTTPPLSQQIAAILVCSFATTLKAIQL
jgi:hypothetical protein